MPHTDLLLGILNKTPIFYKVISLKMKSLSRIEPDAENLHTHLKFHKESNEHGFSFRRHSARSISGSFPVLELTYAKVKFAFLNSASKIKVNSDFFYVKLGPVSKIGFLCWESLPIVIITNTIPAEIIIIKLNTTVAWKQKFGVKFSLLELTIRNWRQSYRIE